MRAKILLCALGLILLAALVWFDQPKEASAQSSEGACFQFPEDAVWSLFPNGFHNGCESLGCSTVRPIYGFDYLAPQGTKILSPFEGTVTANGTDVLGNTYLRIKYANGPIEFGTMHGVYLLLENTEVTAGQVVGTVASLGNSSEPHSHTYFLNLDTWTNERDHSKYWNCVGNAPPADQPDPPGPSEETLSWFEKLAKLVKEYFEQLGKPPVVVSPPQEEPEKYTFSISAQKPGDTDYQHNIRAFFAWPTSGENLGEMQKMDLGNFEGSWLIPGEATASLNDFFGSKEYEKGQGMKIPSTGRIGDGSCNAASFVSYVAAKNGLQVDRDDPKHDPVPGVPQEWVATVCIPTAQYPCTAIKDVRVTNPFDYPIRLHWKVQGDNVSLWVEKVGYIDPPGAEIDWGRLLNIVAVVVGLSIVILIIINSRRPDLIGDTILQVSDSVGFWKRVFLEAFKIAWGWTLTIIVATFIFSGMLPGIRKGFLNWIGGETAVPNWELLVLGIVFLTNLIWRAVQAARKAQMFPASYSKDVRAPTKHKWWFWLLLGAIYIIAPDLLSGLPADDILVGAISIYLALPSDIKVRIKWFGVLLLVITGVMGYLISTGEIKGNEVEPTPPQQGINPYYDEFMRASETAGTPPEWVTDSSLIKLIEAESGWNPKAKNPNSTAFGLFQLLESTHKIFVPEVPYGTVDPYWQAVGGFRYIKYNYGSPSCAWNFWLATVNRIAKTACFPHREKARTWISNKWSGY